MTNKTIWENAVRDVYAVGWFTDEAMVYGDAPSGGLGGDGGIADGVEFDTTGDGEWL